MKKSPCAAITTEGTDTGAGPLGDGLKARFDKVSQGLHESSRSVIAETARLETATETLAAYIGYLTNQILDEEDKAIPNVERIKALERECDSVISERRAITPDNYDLINRAIYVYAPHLKQCNSKYDDRITRVETAANPTDDSIERAASITPED